MNEIKVHEQHEVTKSGVFQSMSAFKEAQEVAKVLSQSEIIPAKFRNKVPNVMIALEMSNRMNISPIMVMQNIDIIQGNPYWKSQFTIASLNSCGRFKPLRFEFTKPVEKVVEYIVWVGPAGNKTRQKKQIKISDIICYAYTSDLEGNTVKGPEVSITMAVREGWYTKAGSKWPNMPMLMLSYRAAKFFGNLYAPDVMFGMNTANEAQDAEIIETISQSTADKLNKKMAAQVEEVPVEEVPVEEVAQETFQEFIDNNDKKIAEHMEKLSAKKTVEQPEPEKEQPPAESTADPMNEEIL